MYQGKKGSGVPKQRGPQESCAQAQSMAARRQPVDNAESSDEVGGSEKSDTENSGNMLLLELLLGSERASWIMGRGFKQGSGTITLA